MSSVILASATVAGEAAATAAATTANSIDTASTVASGGVQWIATQLRTCGEFLYDLALAVASYVKPLVKELVRIGTEQSERLRDFIIANKRETTIFAMGGIICSVLVLASFALCCSESRESGNQEMFA